MTTTARIPLLRDHHTHPLLYSSLAGCPQIGTLHHKHEALDLMAASCNGEELNVVMGWNDSRFTFSSRELAPFPPLVILNNSLHFLVMNRAAAEIVTPRFPRLAEHLDDREWVERHCAQLLGLIMTLRPCNGERLRSFFRDLACQGVWFAEEMSLAGRGEISAMQEAGLASRSAFWAAPATWETLDTKSRKQVQGIKLFADGALGARTARLSLPYRGGQVGVLVYDDDQLLAQLTRVAETGRDIAIHAIGDTAIDQVVEAVGRLGQPAGRIRMEHCQFISRETAIKAKRQGIVLCMQPNFSSESATYRDRLPPPFPGANNPFRMLIDDAGYLPGRDLLLGSDGMPHGISQALENALFPPFPGQRLFLDELVAGYCMPDCSNGFIDVVIDHDERSVTTGVTLMSR